MLVLTGLEGLGRDVYSCLIPGKNSCVYSSTNMIFSSTPARLDSRFISI